MSKKHALITGGSGDIGQAIAQALALTNNYHVIIHTYQNLTKAEELVATIQQQGGLAQVCQFDLANPEQIQIALQKLLAQAPIQILINNAGIHADAPLAGMSPENWHQVIEVNLNSFYHLTQPLLLPMMATRWGRIINISSIAAITGNRGQANYSAAKAGLHGASKTLAIELASRNITVNVVAPGIITTEMSTQFNNEQIKALVPMQRAGTPEEVSALVSFLVSEEAGYISGQIISINGAMI